MSSINKKSPRLSFYCLSCFIIAGLLSTILFPVGIYAQTPLPPTETPTPLPTETPSPTQEPTATDIPTDPPTQTAPAPTATETVPPPSPTKALTPSEIAPTQTSTPTSTSLPTETPTPTSPPTATTTPSPTVTPSPRGPSIMAGSFSGCTPPPTTVTAGQTFTIQCTFSVTLAVGATVNFSQTAMPAGWTSGITITATGASITNLAPTNAAGTAKATILVALLSSVKVTWTITAPANAPFGMTFDRTYTGCTGVIGGLLCPGNGGTSSHRVTTNTPALVEGNQYSLACTPVTLSPKLNQALQSICTITTSNWAGTSTLRINPIRATSTFSGWTIKAGNLTLTSGTTGTWDPGWNMPKNSSQTFTISVQPTSCTATAAPVINTNITATSMGSQTGGASTSTNKTINASFTPSPSVVTTSMTSKPARVSVNYSMNTDQTRQAVIVMQVTATGCTPWSLSISATPFAAQPGARVRTLPRHGNFTMAAPVVTTGSPTGIVNIGTGTLSTTARTILSGPSPNGTVSVTQTMTLTYTIPATTLVGIYTSQITIATGSGQP